jgi:nitrogen fixation protein
VKECDDLGECKDEGQVEVQLDLIGGEILLDVGYNQTLHPLPFCSPLSTGRSVRPVADRVPALPSAAVGIDQVGSVH